MLFFVDHTYGRETKMLQYKPWVSCNTYTELLLCACIVCKVLLCRSGTAVTFTQIWTGACAAEPTGYFLLWRLYLGETHGTLKFHLKTCSYAKPACRRWMVCCKLNVRIWVVSLALSWIQREKKLTHSVLFKGTDIFLLCVCLHSSYRSLPY